jgi:hypothetical protein
LGILTGKLPVGHVFRNFGRASANFDRYNKHIFCGERNLEIKFIEA